MMAGSVCPFCGEPAVRRYGKWDSFRCGTEGPDESGVYSTGHTCDVTMYNRLLAEKDAEIQRLRVTIDEWERCGEAIMAAIGKTGPLSDSEVIGEIERLRALLIEGMKGMSPGRAIAWRAEIAKTVLLADEAAEKARDVK